MKPTKQREPLRIIESVAYFVDPKSRGSLGFLGERERTRIPTKMEHKLLDAFKHHLSEHASLNAKAEERGLGL